MGKGKECNEKRNAKAKAVASIIIYFSALVNAHFLLRISL